MALALSLGVLRLALRGHAAGGNTPAWLDLSAFLIPLGLRLA
jgi:hypothetical protein